MKYLLLLTLFLPSCTTISLSYTDERGRSFGGGVTLEKGYAK